MNNGDTRVLARWVGARALCVCGATNRQIAFRNFQEICSLRMNIISNQITPRARDIWNVWQRSCWTMIHGRYIDWYILICNFQISLLCVEEAFRHRTDVLVLSLSLSLLLLYDLTQMCYYNDEKIDFVISVNVILIFVSVSQSTFYMYVLH